MHKVSALQIRQSLGKILAEMERTEAPVLVEKGKRPAAVLVPLKMFYERFADGIVHDERVALHRWIQERQKRKTIRGPSSDRLVRALRGKLP